MELTFLDGYAKVLEKQIKDAIEIIRLFCKKSAYDCLNEYKINFYYNPRLSKAWARCTKPRCETKIREVSVKSALKTELYRATIDFSKYIFNIPNDRQIEVIIHELFHVIAPASDGHKGEWLSLANSINQNYNIPYRITRLVPKELSSMVSNLEPEKKYKYKVVCPTCKTEFFYFKKTKVIANLDSYRCARCKSHYELIQL